MGTTAIKLRSIIVLAIGLALAANTLRADPNSSLPEGDQHVALLSQQLTDIESAGILLKRCIDEGPSNAEVVNAFNVLDDNYDRLCAHMAQFYVWAKYWKTSAKPSEFSLTAQEELRELNNRINTVLTSQFQELANALQKRPQYTNDPQITAAAQRLIASSNKAESFKAQADRQ